MKKEVFSGKDYEEAKSIALESLKKSEEEVLIKELGEKKSLFNKKCEIEVINKEDIISYVKDFITKVVTLMGATCNIEHNVRDGVSYFNVLSEKSAILIGKNGKNIDALQMVVRENLNLELGCSYHIIIDVCDYKKQREARLTKLAKMTAKEVARNKIEVKLDPMNSYERRIIHNALSKSVDVKTESTGVEPNRCVVIKPKED